MSVTIDLAALDQLIADSGRVIERTVADGVTYGIYQELGTSRMNAHPFMSPAVEDVRAGFMLAAAQVVNNTQAAAIVVKTAHDVERIAKKRAPFRYGILAGSIHVEPE